jgi:hypothetical protein
MLDPGTTYYFSCALPRSVSRLQTVDFQIHFSARRSFSGPFDSVQPQIARLWEAVFGLAERCMRGPTLPGLTAYGANPLGVSRLRIGWSPLYLDAPFFDLEPCCLMPGSHDSTAIQLRRQELLHLRFNHRAFEEIRVHVGPQADWIDEHEVAQIL